MATESTPLAFSPTEAKQIREAFGDAFKGVMAVNIQTESLYQDSGAYTRSGRPDMVPTGTCHLYMELPQARFDSAYTCFEGTQIAHHLIVKTLEEEGVAQLSRGRLKSHPLAGEGIFDEDPAPQPVLDLKLTTNDMGRITAAAEKAADAVKVHLTAVNNAAGLLSEKGIPAFHDTSAVIKVRPDNNGRYLTERGSKQQEALKGLVAEGAIGMEWFGGEYAISVRDPEKLAAALEKLAAIEPEQQKRRYR